MLRDTGDQWEPLAGKKGKEWEMVRVPGLPSTSCVTMVR